jgi:hypothetical protein
LALALVCTMTVIGYIKHWTLLGALTALVVVVVPTKWLFLFYMVDFERDAHLGTVVGMVGIGFVSSIAVTLSMFGIRSYLEHHIGSAAYAVLAVVTAVVEIVVCFVMLNVILSIAHDRRGFDTHGTRHRHRHRHARSNASRQLVNLYSGLIYGLAFGVGFGACTALWNITREYLGVFADWTSQVPYFLWVVKHLYSLNFLMACSVWIGLGISKRTFVPPSTEHDSIVHDDNVDASMHSLSLLRKINAVVFGHYLPAPTARSSIDSPTTSFTSMQDSPTRTSSSSSSSSSSATWTVGANSERWLKNASIPRTVLLPLLMRIVFLLLASALPDTMRYLLNHARQLPFASHASIGLWVYVCEDLIGLVLFVVAFVFLLRLRRTHKLVLEQHLPDPILYYSEADELDYTVSQRQAKPPSIVDNQDKRNMDTGTIHTQALDNQ